MTNCAQFEPCQGDGQFRFGAPFSSCRSRAALATAAQLVVRQSEPFKVVRPVSMLSNRTCSGASTTGRLAPERSDFAQRSHPRCRHRLKSTSAAAGSCSESSIRNSDSSDRPPNIYQKLTTAALLTAVVGAWGLVSANSGSTSAFLSVTGALTDAGASSAGEEGNICTPKA